LGYRILDKSSILSSPCRVQGGHAWRTLLINRAGRLKKGAAIAAMSKISRVRNRRPEMLQSPRSDVSGMQERERPSGYRRPVCGNMPAHPPSPVVPHGGWVSYGGRDAALLAIVLIASAAAVVYVGTRLRSPISVTRPGRTVGSFMIAIWALAICTFFVAAYAYGLQLKQVQSLGTPRTGQVGAPRRAAIQVGTLPDAAVTFFVILYLTRGYGWKVALGSAFVGTAAAPMIFELPFDLIVMGRTAAIPPNPTLYRALLLSVIYCPALDALAADAAAIDANHRSRLLRFGGNVRGVRAVGSVWIWAPNGAAAEDAQCHLKDVVFRQRNHAFHLAGDTTRAQGLTAASPTPLLRRAP